jgi:hypothetical protein
MFQRLERVIRENTDKSLRNCIIIFRKALDGEILGTDELQKLISAHLIRSTLEQNLNSLGGARTESECRLLVRKVSEFIRDEKLLKESVGGQDEWSVDQLLMFLLRRISDNVFSCARCRQILT